LIVKKLIFSSFLFVVFIVGLCLIFTSSTSDFEEGIFGLGICFSFFGLLITIVLKFSLNNQNVLYWMKERLKLEKKMKGMPAKRKKREEIKLLNKVPPFYYGSFLTTYTDTKNYYNSMSVEKFEKIGSKSELKKLKFNIKFREEIMPLSSKTLLVSGIILILIRSIKF